MHKSPPCYGTGGLKKCQLFCFINTHLVVQLVPLASLEKVDLTLVLPPGLQYLELISWEAPSTWTLYSGAVRMSSLKSDLSENTCNKKYRLWCQKWYNKWHSRHFKICVLLDTEAVWYFL